MTEFLKQLFKGGQATAAPSPEPEAPEARRYREHMDRLGRLRALVSELRERRVAATTTIERATEAGDADELLAGFAADGILQSALQHAVLAERREAARALTPTVTHRGRKVVSFDGGSVTQPESWT